MARFCIDSRHSDLFCVSHVCHSWHTYPKIGWILVMYTKNQILLFKSSCRQRWVSGGKTGFLLKHIIRSLVFEGFTSILFSLVHFETSSATACMLLTGGSIPFLSSALVGYLRISDAVESSTYLIISMSTSRLFIWVMKRRDPSLVPCGTPPFSVIHFEITWSYSRETTCLLCCISYNRIYMQSRALGWYTIYCVVNV